MELSSLEQQDSFSDNSTMYYIFVFISVVTYIVVG